MSPSSLKDAAALVCTYGSTNDAKRILRHLADRKGWCAETFRARWDGTRALLSWWHMLERHQRPPLWDLSEQDARAFLEHLESMDLSRKTVKGYRSGAAAFSGALRACRIQPVAFDPDYRPFKGVYPSRKETQASVDVDTSWVSSPKHRVKLDMLLALLDLDVSVPEACSRVWQDIDTSRRLLLGYGQRTVVLGAEAVIALERLVRLKPRRYASQKLIGWTPATARKWLKLASLEAQRVSCNDPSPAPTLES